MALIKCNECSRPISDKAKACPICGNPIAPFLKIRERELAKKQKRPSYKPKITNAALMGII